MHTPSHTPSFSPYKHSQINAIRENILACLEEDIDLQNSQKNLIEASWDFQNTIHSIEITSKFLYTQDEISERLSKQLKSHDEQKEILFAHLPALKHSYDTLLSLVGTSNLPTVQSRLWKHFLENACIASDCFDDMVKPNCMTADRVSLHYPYAFDENGQWKKVDFYPDDIKNIPLETLYEIFSHYQRYGDIMYDGSKLEDIAPEKRSVIFQEAQKAKTIWFSGFTFESFTPEELQEYFQNMSQILSLSIDTHLNNLTPEQSHAFFSSLFSLKSLRLADEVMKKLDTPYTISNLKKLFSQLHSLQLSSDTLETVSPEVIVDLFSALKNLKSITFDTVKIKKVSPETLSKMFSSLIHIKWLCWGTLFWDLSIAQTKAIFESLPELEVLKLTTKIIPAIPLGHLRIMFSQSHSLRELDLSYEKSEVFSDEQIEIIFGNLPNIERILLNTIPEKLKKAYPHLVEWIQIADK